MKNERLFGTDGIRGRFGEGWLTVDSISALGRAVGVVLVSDAEVLLEPHGASAALGARGTASDH